MSFKSDLKSGEDIEQEILQVVQQSFPHAQKNEDKSTRELYDIIIPKLDKQKEILIEVKGDFYKSKNLAFECLGTGGRNTGIIKTKAHYWIHYRNEKYLVWDLVRLKKYLLDLGGFMRFGGDRDATGMWVVPEEKVLKECPPEIIVERGSKELNKFLTKHI